MEEERSDIGQRGRNESSADELDVNTGGPRGAAAAVASGPEPVALTEQRLRALGVDHAVITGGRKRPDPRKGLRSIRRRLERAWRDLPVTEADPIATEWLLDNAYLIVEAVDLVREALPPGFVGRLPCLAAPPYERRITALARRLVPDDGDFEPGSVTSLVAAYQKGAPLTIAEVWALPALLRLVVLERLASEAAAVLGGNASTAAESGGEAGARIGRLVESLREMAVHDWRRFFEAVSTTEAALRLDPAGVHPAMNFETRDRYRKVVEELARRSRRTEVAVAELAVRMARDATDPGPPSHVGFYLIDDGRPQLESVVDFRRPLRQSVARTFNRIGLGVYGGAVLGLTFLLAAWMAWPALSGGGIAAGLAILLAFLPASAVAVAFVNWIASRLVRPRTLPKLALEDGVTEEHATAVVVPALLSNEAEIAQLLAGLERNYHGNRDPALRFVLLSDFTDAPSEHLPDDQRLLELAEAGIRELNARYGNEASSLDGGTSSESAVLGNGASRPDSSTADGPFMLIHRDRRWNPSEGCWMGWERKRGKLCQFNALSLGRPTDLQVRVGNAEQIRGLRFAITLDADTILPPETARLLVGTAAHPLNRPVFDTDGRVVRGYTILQPRIEVVLTERPGSPFARVFEGDRGLDLYSRAVSDVYQDLFGEGIYAGKGVYDIEAFERSLAGVIPENALLSHDLFEGVFGRAALVSDVAVLEDYPHHVMAYLRRLHRWIRGDWQIAPWLLNRVRSETGIVRNRLDALGRWKIADNLRRSLVDPAVLMLLAAGWLILPGSPVWWTAWAAAVPGLSFVFGTLSAARGHIRRPGRWIGLPAATTAAFTELSRWGLSLVLLPYRALIAVDGAARSLIRLKTRRHLLEWSAAASVALRASQAGRIRLWREMLPAPVVGTLVAVLVVIVRPSALPFAGPFLVAWLISPAVAWRISRSRPVDRTALGPTELRSARLLARKTWGFFDAVLGPDDNWLPVDHVQEEPHPHAARRTSPTNAGLGMTAVLAAWDLGYAATSRTSATLLNMLDTFDRLERYRGHFLNWYDTHTLAPLPPRYVSTVDSGNLAACLIGVARGCEAVPDEPLPRAVEVDGLRDSLALVLDATGQPGLRALPGSSSLVNAAMRAIESLPGSGSDPAVCGAVAHVAETRIPELETQAVDLIESGAAGVNPREVDWLKSTLIRARQHASQCRQDRMELMPWLALGASPRPPFDYRNERVEDAWQAFRSAMPPVVTLRTIPGVVDVALDRLRDVDTMLGAADAPTDLVAAAVNWSDGFRHELEHAAERARELTSQLESIASRADALVAAMDFRFLYDPDRHLFRIGYDVDAGRHDASFYDLLTSEARLASLIAMATGAAPLKHWLHLGRPFARAGLHAVLLSWAGTMFEYLLPTLFMRNPDSTLLHFACESAVREQIAHGQRNRLPWGVSESAYHQVDRHGTYQYRAFGVPVLALRRETVHRNVISAYASALALRTHGHDVMENLQRFERYGGVGHYGLYEAIDFGATREHSERGPQVVRSYMAHHQAMILQSITNVIVPDALPERFHRDARVAAVEHLVLERLPHQARLEPPPRVEIRPITRSSTGRELQSRDVESEPERPRVQVLSNGRVSVLVTDRGTGNARWQGIALTRWRSDPAPVGHGTWLYVQDLDAGLMWSPTPEPRGPETGQHILFAPHRVDFRGASAGIESEMTVFVTPDHDVEVRRLHLRNNGSGPRRLAVTSFGEVALGSHSDDLRHAAFNKLFVQSRYIRERQTLMFERRGSSDSAGLCLAHSVVVDPEVGKVRGWDTDRSRFIGRNGSVELPDGLRAGPRGLSGTAGATLDPAFVLGVELQLPASDATVVTFLTGCGRTTGATLAQLDAYRSPRRIPHALREAAERHASMMKQLELSPGDTMFARSLLSAMVFPFHGLRESRSGRLLPGQPALWGLGISGDIPVIAVRTSSLEMTSGLSRILRAHAYLRRKGVQADLLVLVGQGGAGGYAEPIVSWLRNEVHALYGPGAWHQSGGVFHAPVARIGEERASDLAAAAAIVFDAASDPARAVDNALVAPARLPAFVPVPSGPITEGADDPLPASCDLLFDNGMGGFTPDGHEYVIRMEPGRPTPAPWINVIANDRFGFTISETGGGFTWSGDSGRHRLTPWRNDPVIDAPGEVVYLRDEETGEVWSATPGPAPAGSRHEVRHSAGCTTFVHRSHGLDQRLDLFVPVAAALKIARLEIVNRWPRPRRVTVTFYAEWVLGTTRDLTAPHVLTELSPEASAILARQLFSPDNPGRVAFLAANERIHGATADRAEFLGRGGLEAPAGLYRIGLGEVFGSGLDPCAALQIHLDLQPGEKRSVHFLLGDAEDRQGAIDLIEKYRSDQAASDALAEARSFWDTQLDSIQVDTPEPSMNLFLNRWLPYQALACRLWARSALYQSSGAFGFRDQLQDVMAFLMTRPGIARSHILEAAARQFADGDVLHWWHPGTFKGVRTRCSDDLLWLPFVVAGYTEVTGDTAILHEQIPFLEARPLAPAERERYEAFTQGTHQASLYEHCKRAIERGLTRGEHGLPLMGANDWNDGFDHVGNGGRGESVWLGWFLHSTLSGFAAISEVVEGSAAADALRDRAAQLRSALDAAGWDGEWYRRAYYDDGSPLGSADNDEARIDSMSQSWAVLSGAAPPERALAAMNAVERELVDEENALIRLLEPPFDRGPQQPGYIKDYPPGIRENGAQYTHAAVWAAWAFAQLQSGPEPERLFRLLNPILRSHNAANAELYRIEPYVVAADIYATPPHTGRGGWSWYTGSAAWLYRYGLERVLGLQKRGRFLYVDPRIPTAWKELSIRYRSGAVEYRIRVENPAGSYEGVEQVTLDGRVLEGIAIPIEESGTHQVNVRLGTATITRPWSPILW